MLYNIIWQNLIPWALVSKRTHTVFFDAVTFIALTALLRPIFLSACLFCFCLLSFPLIFHLAGSSRLTKSPTVWFVWPWTHNRDGIFDGVYAANCLSFRNNGCAASERHRRRLPISQTSVGCGEVGGKRARNGESMTAPEMLNSPFSESHTETVVSASLLHRYWKKPLKVISSPSQRKKEKRKRKKKEIIPQRFLSSSVGGKESFHKWITREFSTFSPSPVLLSFSRFFLLSLFNLFFHPFSLAAELWLTDPLARRSHTQKRGNPFCYVGHAKRSVCFDGPLIKSFSFHQWAGNLNHSFFKSSILYSCSASKCLYSKGASPGRICTWKRSVILVSFDECNLHSEQPLRTSHQHNSIKFCDAGWECRISN